MADAVAGLGDDRRPDDVADAVAGLGDDRWLDDVADAVAGLEDDRWLDDVADAVAAVRPLAVLSGPARRECARTSTTRRYAAGAVVYGRVTEQCRRASVEFVCDVPYKRFFVLFLKTDVHELFSRFRGGQEPSDRRERFGSEVNQSRPNARRRPVGTRRRAVLARGARNDFTYCARCCIGRKFEILLFRRKFHVIAVVYFGQTCKSKKRRTRLRRRRGRSLRAGRPVRVRATTSGPRDGGVRSRPLRDGGRPRRRFADGLREGLRLASRLGVRCGRETRRPRGAGGHVRRQVSAGAVRVPGQTRPGERSGTDRVLSGRTRPDGRTIVPEVRRGPQMGTVQGAFGGPRFLEPASVIARGRAPRARWRPT